MCFSFNFKFCFSSPQEIVRTRRFLSLSLSNVRCVSVCVLAVVYCQPLNTRRALEEAPVCAREFSTYYYYRNNAYCMCVQEVSCRFSLLRVAPFSRRTFFFVICLHSAPSLPAPGSPVCRHPRSGVRLTCSFIHAFNRLFFFLALIQ